MQHQHLRHFPQPVLGDQLQRSSGAVDVWCCLGGSGFIGGSGSDKDNFLTHFPYFQNASCSRQQQCCQQLLPLAGRQLPAAGKQQQQQESLFSGGSFV